VESETTMSTIKGRIAKKPWWVRKRESCPSCGMTGFDFAFIRHCFMHNQFTCPRCGTSMSMTDFWEFHQDKTSKLADLSNEQESTP
jgi:transcription initiation factor IIE alpha subunit